jgi:hypothetical protein
MSSTFVCIVLAGALAVSHSKPSCTWRSSLRSDYGAIVILLFLFLNFRQAWRHPGVDKVNGIAGRWIKNEWRFYSDREWIVNVLRAKDGKRKPLFRDRVNDDPSRQMTFYVVAPDSAEHYPPNVKWLMFEWAFISDPFTARIPDFDPNSNVGHVIKDVPTEYLALEKASQTASYSKIDRAALDRQYDEQLYKPWKSAELERLYFVMCTITRAPVFSGFRWRTMFDYHTGRWRGYSDADLAAHKEIHRPYW